MPGTPALVNTSAAQAEEALQVLRADPHVCVHEASPDCLADLLRRDWKTPQVIIAGGDGTVAAAAAALIDRPITLAIIPAGTLNHFAHALDLPVDPKAALEVAFHGTPVQAPVAYVNERLFLNTCVVGVYVPYVQQRQRLEQWLGYYGASLVATLHTFSSLRSVRVEVNVEGHVQHYDSPLVFVGNGERKLEPPDLGLRKAAGQDGLHVIIVRHTRRLRLLWLALRALLSGFWTKTPDLTSLMVQRCSITLPASRSTIAVDGELVPIQTPLTVRFRPAALTVQVPRPT